MTVGVLLMQEWEAFTGLIVTDTKHESDKDIPNWIEPDRTPALLLLKVAGPFELILLSTITYCIFLTIVRQYSDVSSSCHYEMCVLPVWLVDVSIIYRYYFQFPFQ